MINDRLMKQAQAEQAMKQAHINHQAGNAGVGQPISQPILERVAGICESVDTLLVGLHAFRDRLEGVGDNGGAKALAPRSSGIEANLSDAEMNLSHCLGLLQHINARF